MALVENIQREDLNPLEEAQGLSRLINELGLTHDAAAKVRTLRARYRICRLTSLAKPVRSGLPSGALEMGHARCCSRWGAAGGAAARVVNGQLSVRETERLVATLAVLTEHGGRQGEAALRRRYGAARKRLVEKFGAVVRGSSRAAGRWRVVICLTLEQLDGIIAKLR
jgi:ParB family chromosome partitioning protein